MFDWTINLGNLLSIGVMIASVTLVLGMLRSKVMDLGDRMRAMEENMKQLVQVLVQQGRHEERMSAIDGRMLAQGQRIDDLTRKIDRVLVTRLEP